MWREMFSRLGYLNRRSTFETELDDEIRFHLDSRVEELEASGLSREDARVQARREFGPRARAQQDSRAAWQLRWLEDIAADLRYALRQLRRNPVFTAVAVASLALGIGANTAIFSVADALVLRTLPVKDPHRLVYIDAPFIEGRAEIFQYRWAATLRDRTGVFSDLSAISLMDRFNVAAGGPDGSMDEGDRSRVTVALVSGNYFSTLGVDALAGRTFTPADDRIPGGHPVAVISYGFWERRFGLAGDVAGRLLRLNETIYTILGVTPRGFSGEEIGYPTDMWIPMAMQSQVMPERPGLLNNPDAPWVRLVARLKPGMTMQQAEADVSEVYNQVTREESGRQSLTREEMVLLGVIPAGTGHSPGRQLFREPLQALLIVVGLVLLIACTNLASLLLARSINRHREMAVRLSLGAGRLRIVRQLLTESILLACLAGAVALIVGHWGAETLARVFRSAEGFAFLDLDVRLDAHILLFTAAVSFVSAMVFGLAPAWRASRLKPFPALKGEAAAAPRRFRLASALLVAQIAMVLVLLTGAGLFVQTLRNLKSQDWGFDREHIWVVRTAPNQAGRTGPVVAEMFQSVQERIARLPGVLAVGVSTSGLLNRTGGVSYTIPGYTRRTDDSPFLDYNLIAPQFFASVGMKLLAGRNFTERDDETSPLVAIVSESMAMHYFGRPDPIGRTFGVARMTGSEIEIVGVVRNAKYATLRDENVDVIYFPYRQDLVRLRNMSVTVRTAENPPWLAARIRQELQSIDPALPVLGIDSIEQYIDNALVQERLIAGLSAFFGLLALLLACIGLYGMMSYAVARRTGEVGVRMALGAQPSDVLALVLRESLWPVVVGLALGVPLALGAARGAANLLFGIAPTDVLTIAGACFLMLATAAAAAFLPARSAARVDPMVALRHE